MKKTLVCLTLYLFLFIISFASARWFLLPVESASYRITGSPWLGLSLNLTFRCMTVLKTSSWKWRFTSPTHVVRAFMQALTELKAEGGVEARHARYCENHRVLVEGMRALGYKTLLPDEQQSPVTHLFLLSFG